MRAVEHVVRSFLSEEVIDPRTKIPVKKVVVNLGCGLFVPPPNQNIPQLIVVLLLFESKSNTKF